MRFALTLLSWKKFKKKEIEKAEQTLTVYDGDQVIATSKVSTGKAGHTTPSGVFSILEKRKYHESNLYSNAPMPWMQRITWSGVALHESNSVPNYPASHGCVPARVPNERSSRYVPICHTKPVRK